MKLVEVVSGVDTKGDARARCSRRRSVGKKRHREEQPGFIVNRIARPFYGEAWMVLSENAASPARSTHRARLRRLPMGRSS